MQTSTLYILLLLAVHFVNGQEEQVIRLVGGATDNQGRVEVFVKGEWGTVCDDRFGMADAEVICKMLGYPKAIRARNRAYYSQGSGPIWVDQLDCTGNEDNIFDCKMNELGNHDCVHKEDAGVECFRPTPAPERSLPLRLACPCNQTCNNVPKRCTSDKCLPSIEVEGIVEVYYNKEWLRISADKWSSSAIQVVCGQLGYPQGFGTLSIDESACDRCDHKVTMRKLDCSGTESELKACYHEAWGPFDNPSCDVATVRCGFVPQVTCGGRCPQNPAQPLYRLRAGPVPWMGRVEVLYNKKWGTVCDFGFNEKSANVLCRSLGYGTAESFRVRAGFGRGIGEVWLNELKCNGNELWLHECGHPGWGETPRCIFHDGDVGVKCRVPSKCTSNGDREEVVRFISEADPLNPARQNTYVEVNGGSAVGGYGLLCVDDVDIEMGQILCRHTKPDPKFFRLYFSAKHTSYRGQRFRGKFECKGTELTIDDCRMAVYPVSTCRSGDMAIECDTGLSDLVPSVSQLETSLKRYPFTDVTVLFYLKCAREENCLASDADNLTDDALRTLLRFDSLTMNYGLREFSPVIHRSEWIWHACHNHYHSFEVFVTYDLLSIHNGNKVAEGHKASFCLEDSRCDSGGSAQRRCGTGTQGISVNCGDLYARHLDCQWIDITGVPDGSYTLLLHVNPERLVFESDYENNIISCNINLSGGGRTIQVISCSQSDHEAPNCPAN